MSYKGRAQYLQGYKAVKQLYDSKFQFIFYIYCMTFLVRWSVVHATKDINLLMNIMWFYLFIYFYKHFVYLSTHNLFVFRYLWILWALFKRSEVDSLKKNFFVSMPHRNRLWSPQIRRQILIWWFFLVHKSTHIYQMSIST